MLKITPENRKCTIFLHGVPMAAPLKMEILKIYFLHVRKGPNIGIEPYVHDHRTSNVKDYPEQPKMGQFFTQGPYGSPPENGNLENHFFSC